MNTSYIYDSNWKLTYENMCSSSYKSNSKPYMSTYENCILLPSKGNEKIWGVGGLLDTKNNFVKESEIDGAFGGYYDYDDHNLEFVDEEVIFIPIIPKHWGHFLIDVLSRFWFVDQYDNIPIFYCGWNWENNAITGNYLELLNQLGIDPSRLIFVDKPIKVKKALIPNRTFGFSINYQDEFKNIINTIITNVSNNPQCICLEPIDKIYFTRREFFKARITEIGEKEIEDTFRNNGYTILAPEKLSLLEQVYYINHATEIVCMSGTIPHNIMFAGENTKLTIINRTSYPNLPQFKINQLFNIDCTYVDCYNKRFIKHPVDYGQIPLWIECNQNFINYCKDNNLKTNTNILMRILVKIRNSIHYYSLKFVITIALKFKNIMPSFLMKKIRT